jgi:hypothetical protein
VYRPSRGRKLAPRFWPRLSRSRNSCGWKGRRTKQFNGPRKPTERLPVELRVATHFARAAFRKSVTRCFPRPLLHHADHTSFDVSPTAGKEHLRHDGRQSCLLCRQLASRRAPVVTASAKQRYTRLSQTAEIPPGSRTWPWAVRCSHTLRSVDRQSIRHSCWPKLGLDGPCQWLGLDHRSRSLSLGFGAFCLVSFLLSRESAEMSLASRSTSVIRPRLPPSMPISFISVSIIGA